MEFPELLHLMLIQKMVLPSIKFKISLRKDSQKNNIIICQKGVRNLFTKIKFWDLPKQIIIFQIIYSNCGRFEQQTSHQLSLGANATQKIMNFD